MTDMPRTIALIPQGGSDAAAARALMAQVRQLTDRRGGSAHLVLTGSGANVLLPLAAETGIDHVWIIPAAGLGTLQLHQFVDLYSGALQTPEVAEGLDQALLLVTAGPDNEAFAGALAARLGAAALGRCTAFEFDAQGGLRAHRTAYGNRLDIAWACAAGPAIAAVRPQGAARDTTERRQPEIHVLPAMPAPRAPYDTIAVPRTEPHAGLDGARLVVAGGRGMGGEAGFRMLYELADKLGAAVGASLPAVDAGWAPVTRQIGISGKYVSPGIYLAVGVSGTPQHLAGIDPHTRIVAINRDADADIFDVAQVGVAAEWQALIPALLEALDIPPS